MEPKKNIQMRDAWRRAWSTRPPKVTKNQHLRSLVNLVMFQLATPPTQEEMEENPNLAAIETWDDVRAALEEAGSSRLPQKYSNYSTQLTEMWEEITNEARAECERLWRDQ